MPNCELWKLMFASVFTVLYSGAWQGNALASVQDDKLHFPKWKTPAISVGQLVTQAETKQKSDYKAFRSFIKEAVGNPDYQVSYQVDMPGKPTTVVKQWFKGNKFRIDTQMQGKNARIYRVNEEITNCISRGSNWKCFNLPNFKQAPASTVQRFQRLEDIENSPKQYQNQITKTGTRVVAGEQTTCFRVEQTQKEQSFLLSCYSNNHGIPLYMEGKNQRGTWKMTAKEFQTSVSDNAFSLPAQPQNIPGMPAGF